MGQEWAGPGPVDLDPGPSAQKQVPIPDKDSFTQRFIPDRKEAKSEAAKQVFALYSKNIIEKN